jgi:pimeloyl-ACP methyl ester carboxylesterase
MKSGTKVVHAAGRFRPDPDFRKFGGSQGGKMNQKRSRYIFYSTSLVINLLITSLLAGCGGLPASVGSHLTGSPTAPKIDLQPCTFGAVSAKCGYLRVPEDRTHPEGRTLDLKAVVVPARDPKPEPDPLFYIRGGPGSIVTEWVENFSSDIFRQVNARRDLVFIDQRGTYDKNRLTCDQSSISFEKATQQQVNDWMKGCLANLDGDPRFYTTIPAMQDLDQARAALGYDKINLYGVSYGTKAVQVYALMFPTRVRAAVLDHGNALDLPLYPTFSRAAQTAMDQLLAYCEQDEKCHAAYPDLRRELRALLDRLSKGPVVTSYVPDGQTEPVSLTLSDMENGIHELMVEGSYDKVPFMIHTFATHDDWTPIVKGYGIQLPSSASAESFLLMKHMIVCFEPAEEYGQVGSDPLNTASYYEDAYLEEARGLQKICQALPKPDVSVIYRPGKPAPISMLMLNSLLDPFFPPSSMDSLLKENPNSRVVVEPTEGHWANAEPKCRWNIMAQFIQQGSVDGLDISCLKEIKPRFVAVGD